MKNIRSVLGRIKGELRYWIQRLFHNGMHCRLGPDGNDTEYHVWLFPCSRTEYARCRALARGKFNEAAFLHAFMQACTTNQVVYDIGANIGIYTLAAAKAVGSAGKVVAFEMDRINYDSLLRNIKKNQLGNVIPINQAVTSHDGCVHYNRNSAEAGDGTPAVSKDDSGTMTATGIAVDTLVVRGNIPPPAVVKIDVEGHEYEVLKGMRHTLEHNNVQLFIEVHDRFLKEAGVNPADMLGWLQQIGYQQCGALGEESRFERHIVLKKMNA